MLEIPRRQPLCRNALHPATPATLMSRSARLEKRASPKLYSTACASKAAGIPFLTLWGEAMEYQAQQHLRNALDHYYAAKHKTLVDQGATIRCNVRDLGTDVII